MHDELAKLDAVSHFPFELKPLDRLLAKGLIEQTPAGFTVRFGLVHRRVGVAQQIVSGVGSVIPIAIPILVEIDTSLPRSESGSEST